jgi:nucleoside-diphosphate-sugar epimerase
MKIAVAGATGRVGRHVVDVVKARGHDVVAISRATGVDVITGNGLADALAGVETVSDPGDPDRDVFEKGGLLPGPGAMLAGPTFEEWLDTDDAALNVTAAH